jgi:predicted CXXCH cytochrome family protein
MSKKVAGRLVNGLIAGVMVATAGTAMAAISATKHNLSSSGSGTNHVNASGTGQICVFCHTPHAANVGAAVPLWNKALPASSGFTLYNAGPQGKTSSLQGEILSVGSVSIACLSCHDGSQAMDNMINAPGAGGFTSGGASAGYTWTGVGQLGTAVTNLGKDLSNDHPIGIQFCGGGLSGSGGTNSAPAAASGTCADGDFRQTDVKTFLANGSQIFFVDVNGTAGRQSTDIALYTRTFSGSASGPSVECGSCHDPHQASKNSDNMNFMRVTTTGSSICLSCHVK